MKDDSLSDAHPMQTLINKLNSGIKVASVGKQDLSSYQKMREAREAMEAVCISMEKEKQDNVYAKQIWNDAIEAAEAKLAETNCSNIADEIRKLKK